MIIVRFILFLIALPFIFILFSFAIMWFGKLLEIFIQFLDDILPDN